MFPALEALLPYLSERGTVEVDLALAKWQYADLQRRHEEMSAHVVELEAEKTEAAVEPPPVRPSRPEPKP